MKIYLAGKVAKGDEIGSIADWRQQYVNGLSHIENVCFVSPEDPNLDESKPLEIFGHDCWLIQEADIVIINASSKLGVGTAQEMVIAKYFNKHVFTILPRDTHHRRTNLRMYDVLVEDWIHPFIYSMSDKIFETINELSQFLCSSYFKQLSPRKICIIDEAISAYVRMDKGL